jgi:hypothetical protein
LKRRRSIPECEVLNLLRSGLITGVGLLLASGVALAGGDEYDASKDVEALGPAYFGFVRDASGRPISDASVILTPKSGDPVSIQSNVLGLYRSHVRKGVVPDDVEVSCSKNGFKLSRVFRRTPPGSKDMFIETDCTLQPL